MKYLFRVLHLSDVHFRSVDIEKENLDDAVKANRIAQVQRELWRWERVLGKPWVSNLEEVLADGRAPDVICLTGDIADWGLAGEYARASKFVDELIQLTGVARQRIFVVPGNHDVSRRHQRDAWEGMRAIPAHLAGKVSEWMAGGGLPYGAKSEWRSGILERTKSFWNWVGGEFARPELLPSNSPHGRLGYQVSLDCTGLPFPVYMIGLETQWLSGDDGDARKLRLSDDQIGRLCTAGDGSPLPGLRVVLGHHPLGDLGDEASARRLLADYSDLYLHGHQHDPITSLPCDPDRSFIELAAGCLFEGDEKDKYRNAFQVVDIGLDNVGRSSSIDLRFRAWSDRGHWHDDAAIYKSAEGGRLRLNLSAGARASTSPGNSTCQTSADVRIATGAKIGGDLEISDVVVRSGQKVDIGSEVEVKQSAKFSNIRISGGSGDAGS